MVKKEETFERKKGVAGHSTLDMNTVLNPLTRDSTLPSKKELVPSDFLTIFCWIFLTMFLLFRPLQNNDGKKSWDFKL